MDKRRIKRDLVAWLRSAGFYGRLDRSGRAALNPYLSRAVTRLAGDSDLTSSRVEEYASTLQSELEQSLKSRGQSGLVLLNGHDVEAAMVRLCPIWPFC